MYVSEAQGEGRCRRCKSIYGVYIEYREDTYIYIYIYIYIYRLIERNREKRERV
jgi:hypothetical protein